MDIPRYVGTPLILTVLGTASACSETPTLPPTEIDPVVREAMAADVELMVPDLMAGWWRTAHDQVPAQPLVVAADARTSSWRNWGMMDVGAEPRNIDLARLDEEYGLVTTPWMELYRSLASARDVLEAIDEGVEVGEGGADTHRAVVFAKFMQGLVLGTLAELYQRAFILDETTDPGEVRLAPYPDVMRAALAKLQESIDVAREEPFTIPAPWVAFDRDLDRDGFVRLAHSMRARLAISVARTPAERQAVDWQTVLEDVRAGITQDWGSRYDGDWVHNWSDALDKILAAEPFWSRVDYRMIGPADASGAYQAWLALPPAERQPFPILTDDRRITGADGPTDAGTLMAYAGDGRFLPQRGTYHFSYYADTRWAAYLDAWGEAFAPDFAVEELSFIEAEALYRTGDRAGAMAIVNRTRTAAGLDAFTDPNGPAPGGWRCVPKRDDGSCGDLWDALAYEKRIELFQYGPFTEFVDDRGWGDLLEGTFLDFPPATTTLEPVLQKIYELSSGSAAVLANDLSAGAIRAKREAYQAWDAGQNHNPGDFSNG